MDTWYSGLVRTLDVLDAAGLEHVGTYRTQQERDTVKIIDVGGIKLAMLAYTFSTNGLPVDSEHPYCVSVYTSDYMTDCSAVDYDLIQSDLDKAGQSGADAIAVYVHWGNEYHTEPSEQQEQLADTCLRTARHWCSRARPCAAADGAADAAGRPHRLSVLLSRQPDLQPV